MAVIAAAGAACARQFPCLRRLKIYLRSNMAVERLSRLSLVALEKEFVKQLDLDTVVDKFYSKHRITRIFL
jgi:hypothetical protein